MPGPEPHVFPPSRANIADGQHGQIVVEPLFFDHLLFNYLLTAVQKYFALL